MEMYEICSFHDKNFKNWHKCEGTNMATKFEICYTYLKLYVHMDSIYIYFIHTHMYLKFDK